MSEDAGKNDDERQQRGRDPGRKTSGAHVKPHLYIRSANSASTRRETATAARLPGHTSTGRDRGRDRADITPWKDTPVSQESSKLRGPRPGQTVQLWS